MRQHHRAAPRGASFALFLLLAAVLLGVLSVPSALAAPIVDPSGPKTSLTAPALSSTAAGKVSFTVSWKAASTLPAGYDAWRVEYRQPGVAYWLAWLPSTTKKSAVFTGQAGRCYQFRAAAAKAADPGVIGPWSAVKATAVPADDAAFSVTKTWKRTSASGAYLGKIRTATAKGATATYKFKGTKLALIAPRGRALGKVAVYVRTAKSSGAWNSYKLVKTVDLYAAKTRARVVTTIASGYSASVQRQVKLVVTGKKNRKSTSTKASFDGLAVYGAPHATGQYTMSIQPSSPSVHITEQLQFTASIPGCANQGVEWSVHRVDRFGVQHADGAGAITSSGLYTAPAQPTVTSGEGKRVYYILATAVANPEKVNRLLAITVTPGPKPVITSISPASASPGSFVTITGNHFLDPAGEPEVSFSSLEAEVTGHTATTITVRVPSSGWQTWDTSMTISVRVWSRGLGSESATYFIVTGITPMPPSPSQLNASGTDDDSASPGDTLIIRGYGFAPQAEKTEVRFGSVITTASDYTPDPYSSHYGTLKVVVPQNAQSGALTFRRTDVSGGGWSSADAMYLQVVPATVPTAGLHQSFGGFVTAPRMVRHGAWGEEEWLLQGSGFSKLRLYNYSSTTQGVFWLDMRRNGVERSRIMRAISDTVAVPHRTWGEQIMMPDEIFEDAEPGDTVEVRIRGDELTNRYERTSPWASVTIGARPVYGAVEQLKAAGMVSWWGPDQKIARGSWLWIDSAGSGSATQQLTAPGLWSGTLPVGADGIRTRLVPLTATGTYTITNQTTNESVALTVGHVGEYGEDGTYGNNEDPVLDEEGLLMRVAGAQIEIPPGALSAADLGSWSRFQVYVNHSQSNLNAWDSTLTDGGSLFTVNISPEPTRLLKPITITLPYELAGRVTTPFLGLWDSSSGLYYDFDLPGSQINTLDQTLTLVLPAGEYPAGSGGSAAPAKAATNAAAKMGAANAAPIGPLAAGLGYGLPGGLGLNAITSKVGAVSSTAATSGQDLVWHPDDHPTWGVRVDAVTDSSSSSYMPLAKAQQVLGTAAALWENLAGKGWSEPDAMIIIKVRDYGDPGVYQGSTTKGVFGQPWVYVNSRLKDDARKLDTAVAHEMAHVFQRQLTTNISTKWIDEAVAEWAAWDTLGSGSDLKATFEAGCDFPAVQFPTGFWAGYNSEQAYGAGAFIIWMADTYRAASVLDIYDNLAYYPGNWYDSAAVFQAATGRSLSELVYEFADAFWMQRYEPITTYTWSSRLNTLLSTYTGNERNLAMPVNSSRGLVFAPTAEFASSLSGNPVVARAPGLPVGASIDVYSDSTGASAPPSAPVKIGTLSSLTPVLDLGTHAGGCYRMVAVTPAGEGLSTSIRVEAVRLISVSPTSVPKAGGATVTLGGSGFGDVEGTVMVGAATPSIVSWTDTQIRFTMPNMGSETGAQNVRVSPVVGGDSNVMTITVTN